MRNFSLVSETRKGQRSWDEFWRQIRETKQTWRNKKFNFGAYHSFGNSYSRIAAVKWDVYDIENTTGNARRCHPDRQNSSRFHPCDGDESSVYMAKLRISLPRSRLGKLRSREQSQPVLSCDYIDNFTKGLEVGRDLGNRAHVKRP